MQSERCTEPQRLKNTLRDAGILFAVAVMPVVIFFLFTLTDYTYANIDRDEDRIVLHRQHRFIVQGESLYLPVMKSRALPVWGVTREHYLWPPAKLEQLLSENQELQKMVHSDWRSRYDGKSIFR